MEYLLPFITFGVTFLTSILSGMAGGGGSFIMTPYWLIIGLTPAQGATTGAFTALGLGGGSLAAFRGSEHTPKNKRMKMKNEGKVHWYLSVKYDRDPISGAVSASQELYINQILKKWGLENCNSLPTPFPSKMDTYLDELAKPVDTVDPSLKKDYQSLIGQLLYLQAHTVPEISWTVSQLSRYLIRPGEQHMTAAKKLLRYLQH